MGGYNPKKSGRPTHRYHSAMRATTRLALAVDVLPGTERALAHRMPGIWAWRDALPKAPRPPVLRGDIAYGRESVWREAAAREHPDQTAIDDAGAGPHQDALSRPSRGRGGRRGRNRRHTEAWQAGAGHGVASCCAGHTRARCCSPGRTTIRGCSTSLSAPGRPSATSTPCWWPHPHRRFSHSRRSIATGPTPSTPSTS